MAAKRTASLWNFLGAELTRDYVVEGDEERLEARRRNLYTLLAIPRSVEQFVAYGFFQCTDAFLYLFTFLPLRFLIAVKSIVFRPIYYLVRHGKWPQRFVFPAEACDVLKISLLVICYKMMSVVDISVVYHFVKTQSVIKLYIIFNMLEVGDKLMSTIGQDCIDALFWTATEPKKRKRESWGVFLHLVVACVYAFFHACLILIQATTLNVAINANNKALLTIMLSNNFVELKSSVFRKFDKGNLFQLSCSDIRERFQYGFLLVVIMLLTMKEYAWNEERFWDLLLDCAIILVVECLVDWTKHAFVTRFNKIPLDVYQEYTVRLAYDLALTKQSKSFSDHSDFVSRRLGFQTLPLAVLLMKVMAQIVTIETAGGWLLCGLCYLALLSTRILTSTVILGKACDLLDQHQKLLLNDPDHDVHPAFAPNLRRRLSVDSNLSRNRNPSDPKEEEAEYEILLPASTPATQPTCLSSNSDNQQQTVIENVRVITKSSSNPALLPTEVENGSHPSDIASGDSSPAKHHHPHHQDCDPIEPVTLIVYNHAEGDVPNNEDRPRKPSGASFFVGDSPLHGSAKRRVSVSEGDLTKVGDDDYHDDDDDDEINEWDDDVDGGAKEEEYYAQLLNRSKDDKRAFSET